MNKRDYTEQYYKHLYEKLSNRAYLLEKMLKKKKIDMAKKASRKLDPVGKEDEDVDNDGKPNTTTDKYIKNRREKIKQAMMKKKKVVEEGTIVTNGEIFYGGFPKVVKEETDGEGNWEQFIGLVNTAKKEYFNTLPGKPGKRMMPSNVSKMLDSFTNDPSEAGDNVTDDLIQAGFPAEHIGNAAKIRKASIKQVKDAQAKLDPDFVMGRTQIGPNGERRAPGGYTGD